MADDSKRRSDIPLTTLQPAEPSGDPATRRLLRTVIIVVAAVVMTWFVATRDGDRLDVYKTVDEIRFPDAALAECVTRTARAHGWNDVGQFFTLRCNHPDGGGISDLTGLEHFVVLRDLNLAFNSVADVSPIAGLPHLAVLELSHNRIASMPALRSAISLKRLELNYNSLESLDWLGEEAFPLLESLALGHNHIVDISPLARLAGLKELTLRGNRIADAGSLAALSRLDMLDIGANYLADARPIGQLRDLRRLFIDANRISSLEPLAGLDQLERLQAGFNPLESSAGLSGMVRLQRLDLRHTGLGDLDNTYLLGDIEELKITENPELDCGDVERAIDEFGASAVIADERCLPPGKPPAGQ